MYCENGEHLNLRPGNRLGKMATKPGLDKWWPCFTDEETVIEYDSYFIYLFDRMMHIMSKNTFRVEQLKSHNQHIQEVIDFIETTYPESLYKDTRETIKAEIKALLNN